MVELTKTNWIGIALGVLILASSFFFTGTRFFYLIIGVGIIIAVVPFVFSVIIESKISAEKERMFIEFTRNLVESVKTGTPISKSIVNVRNKPYGLLSEHIKKLSNQITLGIPLGTALKTFADDVNNSTVTRAITLIGEAEKAGGNIGEILEAVAGAVTLSDKIKKERQAAISTLVIQGYIIFLIFLVIILVMQFRILPLVAGMANVETIGLIGATTTSTGAPIEQSSFSDAFLYLLLAQGFFSGLAIGLLAEGSLKAGIKHSFALMLISFIVSAGARLFI